MLIRRLLYVLAAMSVAWPAVPSLARDFKPVTGREWTSATEREKKAFLYGLGTMIQLEHEVAKQQNLPAERASLVPTFIRGLQNTNLMGVMRVVDQYYAGNPAQLDRPVVDVIWRDIALPGAQQAQTVEGR